MPAFYRSKWFPYVLPFLIYLVLIQAEGFLPEWRNYLYGARVILCAGLLWMWRGTFKSDLTETPNAIQYVYALTSGAIAFGLWPLAVHFEWIVLTPTGASPYSTTLTLVVQGIKLAGFIIVFPILNELFWRSFMLRYFITPDFQSVRLGQFQLFSLLCVTVLSGFAFQYGLVLGGVSLIMSLLLIWQKNLLTASARYWQQPTS